MIKSIFRLWMLAAAVLPGLASCTDNDDNAVKPEGVETVEAPDETLPTIDLMTTRVTVPLATCMMGNFEEGSTGAALVKRLPQVTTAMTPDTRMVLLPGSAFGDDGLMADEMMPIARHYMNGGYIALVRPTYMETAHFMMALVLSVTVAVAEDEGLLFDIPQQAARRSASQSPMVERLKARARNLQAAATRGSDDGGDLDPDALLAELLILGPSDYFMQDPLNDEVTAYVHSGDGEGQETDAKTVTAKTERTPYVSGVMADAAAQWLNATEAKNHQPAAARHAQTRASGSSAINEMMDASETFTHSGVMDWTDWDNHLVHRTDKVVTVVRSWGIHNMESNKDYYYVKQNVTLKMGDGEGWKMFYPLGTYTWYSTYGYGEYSQWYGAWLSRYETSMDLAGSGSIMLEAATPSTDNSSQTTSISIGSSTSQTVTNGISWSGSLGASPAGPLGNLSVGGSYSVGTTAGTSFTMGMTKTYKDLGVTKNTSGNKVTWTYKATMPQYYETSTDYCHQAPADILVNDCDLADEICWSVNNPSGQYTMNITSAPQTAALLFVYTKKDNAPHKYEYTTTETANYSHELLEPNRAMQTWRMNITIDEWSGPIVVGALGALESDIRNAFPDLYANVFKIADKTPTSLNTIAAIVKYTTEVMGNRLDILQSYARSYGIRQFTIHWTCDNLNVKTREGFVVAAE